MVFQDDLHVAGAAVLLCVSSKASNAMLPVSRNTRMPDFRDSMGLDFQDRMLYVVDELLSTAHEFSNLSLKTQLRGLKPALQL